MYRFWPLRRELLSKERLYCGFLFIIFFFFPLILNKCEPEERAGSQSSTVMVRSHVMVEKQLLFPSQFGSHTCSSVHFLCIANSQRTDGIGFLELLLVLSTVATANSRISWFFLDHGALSYGDCICFCLLNIFYSVFLAFYFCGPRNFCYYVFFLFSFNIFSSLYIEWNFLSGGQMVA